MFQVPTNGMQQQRRTRTAGTQTLQTTLRKLRALDVILTVGRGVKHPDKGTAAGEEVLVESMQCLLALVQVRTITFCKLA